MDPADQHRARAHAEGLKARQPDIWRCVGRTHHAHDDARRGTLEVGKLADLAVLSNDYLSVPVEEIGGIHSLLTLVGGRVVYAEGDYKKVE